MIPRRAELFAAAADELNSCSEALVRVAQELRGVALGIETEQPELLKLQAIGLQAEAMRASMAALTARAVSERLAVVARIDADTEAMDDG